MTLQTKEIIIKELDKIPDSAAGQILNFIQKLKGKLESDTITTHIASETSLANDWLNPEEDEAWKDL